MVLVSNPLARQSNKASCAECGRSHVLQDNETGELVCQSCGIVISSTLLNLGPDWRAFDLVQKENRPRVGAPMTWTIHDKGLSTNIGWRNQDAYGRKLSQETRSRLYRLRKWQRRSKISDSRNRNLSIALSEMNNIQSKINLPRNVIETGSMIYRQALKANLIRGRTIQSVVVACIYMACRQCQVIRTLEDVAGSCNISKKDAARLYRFLFKELNPSVPKVDPESIIGKITSRLLLNGETERLAKAVLRQATSMRLTGGRGPAGMAAACIYISNQITGDRRTQSMIAEEAQVTEVTVRNRYKELVKLLEIEIQL